MRTVDERHNHIAHAGFDLHGNFCEARHDLVAPRRSLAIHESLIRGSTNRSAEHDLAVDHDDERSFIFHRGGVEAEPKIKNVDAILAVGREVVLEPHAAARARRQRQVALLTGGEAVLQGGEPFALAHPPPVLGDRRVHPADHPAAEQQRDDQDRRQDVQEVVHGASPLVRPDAGVQHAVQ